MTHLRDLVHNISIDFPLRGARNYVQGADIYSAIVSRVSDVFPEVLSESLRITMHQMSYHQCNLIFANSADLVQLPAMGRTDFLFSHGVHGWLQETSAPLSIRLPYDESEIVRRVQLIGQTIRVIEAPPYTPIEVVIAATKHLHQNLLPVTDKKWIVTKLEFMRLLQERDTPNLEIELLQNLNNRLTRCAVRSTTEMIGHIYFSAIAS
jgi:hypothetical protein